MKRINLIISLMLGFVLTISFASMKSKAPEKRITAEQRLERGRRIVLGYCALCHGSDDGKLAGKMMTDIPAFVGTIHSANITQDMDKGIGKYTRQDLIKLLRTGYKRDGTRAVQVMPHFPFMADDDIEGIVDFLKSDNYSVQPSSTGYSAQKVKFIGRMVLNKMKGGEMPTNPIPLPDTLNKIAYGKYLLTAVYRCYECHSGDLIPLDEDPLSSKKYLAGGNRMADEQARPVRVLNITPDKETGIGNYSEEDFRTLITTGKRKNGKMVRFPMAPLSMLTTTEISSIYAYLMSVPPIKHQVKEFEVKDK